MEIPATPENHSFHIPHWIVVILLLFIPPVGWWHMWKNHRYHSWFPYLLWLNAAIMLGFATYVVIHFYPLLTSLVTVTSYIFLSHIGLLLLAVFEIIFGFYLIKMFKNEAVLRRRILAIVIAFLFVNTIAIPVSQLVINSVTKNKTTKTPAIQSQEQSGSQNQNNANWKSYQTDGVRFQYPGSWYEGPSNGEGNGTTGGSAILFSNYPFDTKENASKPPDYLTLYFTNSYGKPDTTLTLKSYSDIDKENASKNLVDDAEKTVMINGTEYFQFGSYTNDKSLYRLTALTVKNGQRYKITLSASTPNMINKNKETFDKILSTFKFSDQDGMIKIINAVLSTFPKETTWQQATTGTINYTNFSTHNAKPQTLTGISQTGSGLVKTLATAQAENKMYLKQNGWIVDNNQAADGPTGSVWGYKKTEKGKTQILQLSYTNSSITPVPNQPIQTTCPCNLTYKIFLSNPF